MGRRRARSGRARRRDSRTGAVDHARPGRPAGRRSPRAYDARSLVSVLAPASRTTWPGTAVLTTVARRGRRWHPASIDPSSACWRSPRRYVPARISFTRPVAAPIIVGVDPALTIGTSRPAASIASAAARECPDLVVGRAGARLGARVAVATVAEHAFDHEAELAGGPGDVGRPLRVRRPSAGCPDRSRSGPAAAARSPRRPPRAARRRRPSSIPTARSARVVDGPQPGGLRSDGPDRIGQEQVRQAGRREDLGLAERADRQPDRADLELEPAERHALVGLDVRPQARRPGRRARPGAGGRSPRRRRGRRRGPGCRGRPG